MQTMTDFSKSEISTIAAEISHNKSRFNSIKSWPTCVQFIKMIEDYYLKVLEALILEKSDARKVKSDLQPANTLLEFSAEIFSSWSSPLSQTPIWLAKVVGP